MDRGERRFRTARKARRQLKLRVKYGWTTRLEAGYFKKWRAMSCRCRKHRRGYSPKVVASMCHHSNRGYHPAVQLRHDARTACAERTREYREAAELD